MEHEQNMSRKPRRRNCPWGAADVTFEKSQTRKKMKMRKMIMITITREMMTKATRSRESVRHSWVPVHSAVVDSEAVRSLESPPCSDGHAWMSTELIVPAVIRNRRIRTASAWAFGFLISCYQIFGFGNNAPNLQHFS
jgi:hypothetical protein